MIITISREFGSGGRELGKRLSDALGIPCYDHEIIQMIAEKHGFTADYVSRLSEKSIQVTYPLTIGNRLSRLPSPVGQQKVAISVEEGKIIENFAKQGGCVIIGRCADVRLAEYHPFNIFAYADEASKISRCMQRSKESEKLTQAELRRRMREVDKSRAKYRVFFSNQKWGAKEGYHLCVNTSGKEIKALIPALVAYVKGWFGEDGAK